MNNQKKGFTLIELLIVLALIAILAGVIIVVVRPAEIFKRGRDTKRIGDLRNISIAIDNFVAEASNNPGLYNWPERGTCTVAGVTLSNIYFSTTTTSFPPGWPTSSSQGTIAATGTNTTGVNGTNGWLPINIATITINNLSALPLDPINSVINNVGYFYAFSCGALGEYELSAKLEDLARMVEGGNRDGCGTLASTTCLYEVGPNRSTLY
ncbi:MAG: type II secretion system GspH family protein [Patescibacteria group bacterium]|nr:type II secretion system GspH family protein [Patescibacteria group bacterium]